MRYSTKHLFNRSNWLKAHLYLALIAGFFFALIGLSGSLSIYRNEIDTLINSELFVKNPQLNYQSLDKIFAAIKTAHPNKTGSWTIEMPLSSNGMITAWFEKPSETFFELYAPLMVSVNPYTAEIVKSRFWGSTLTTWILDIHTQFNMGIYGWKLVGLCGTLLCFSSLTGIYLWWPGLNKIREAFKFRTHDGMMLLALDAHRLLGLLSSISLLILAFTGFLLSYPSILENLTGSSGMEHGQTGRTISSSAIPNNHPTGLSAATFVAQAAFPKAQLRRITTPTGDTGIYRINLRQNSEINQRHPYTTVWIDRWSGQIKEIRNPTRFTTGEALASSIWPLHTGEALGPWGRFLWFMSGVSIFLLYVTGVLRWLCKTNKIRDRKINYTIIKRLETKIKIYLKIYRLKSYEYLKKLIRQFMLYILKAFKYIKEHK